MKKETKSLFEVFDTEGKEVIKITSQQVAELISDVFINGGYHEKLDIENEIEDNGYMEKEITLHGANGYDFQKEADERGYVLRDDVIDYPEEILSEVVKTKLKTNSAMEVWKLESVIENLGKFTQEEFENWINNK